MTNRECPFLGLEPQPDTQIVNRMKVSTTLKSRGNKDAHSFVFGTTMSENRTVEILDWTKSGNDDHVTNSLVMKQSRYVEFVKENAIKVLENYPMCPFLSVTLYWNHAPCQFSSIVISIGYSTLTRSISSSILHPTSLHLFQM